MSQKNGRPVRPYQPHSPAELALPDAVAREKMIQNQIINNRAGSLLSAAIPMACALIRQGQPVDDAVKAAITAAENMITGAYDAATASLEKPQTAPAERPEIIQ